MEKNKCCGGAEGLFGREGGGVLACMFYAVQTRDKGEPKTNKQTCILMIGFNGNIIMIHRTLF